MKNFFIRRPLNEIKRRNRYFILAVLFVVLAVSFFIDPYNLDYISCYFLNVTGLHCPTCGMSRSLYSAIHLKFAQSFSYHLFGPILLFLILALIIKLIWELSTGQEIFLNIKSIAKKRFFIFMGMIWFSYWIIKLV